MRIDNLSNLFNSISQPAFGGAARARDAGPVTPAPAATAPARFGGDQVSLSDAGRTLLKASASANGGQLSGAALEAEKNALTALTEKSLTALGVIKPGQAGSAKITFDSLTYEASSSTTLSASRQSLGVNLQGGSLQADSSTVRASREQAASFSGRGTITTADGLELEFEAELQVASIETFEQTQSSVSQQSVGLPPPSGGGFGGLGGADRLLDQLRQSLLTGAQDPKEAREGKEQGGTRFSSGLDKLLAGAEELLDLLGSLPAVGGARNAGAAAIAA